MLLSIVIPVFNESEGIEIFHHKILMPELLKLNKIDYEVIYVNDGSKDDSLIKLQSFGKSNKKIKIINLSRNFGKEIATTAGIHASHGDATIIMDSDGQHPPEKMKEFIAKWELGAQVVIGVRASNQNEGFVKKYGSKIFYKLFNTTSGHTITPRSTDYRLIDTLVRDEFIRFSERQRITRGLIDWLGFKREFVEFDSPARLAGEASYGTKQLIKLALNSFIALSLRPLFVFGWIGLVITSISLVAGIGLFIEQIVLQDPLQLNVTGAALLGIFISFLIGIVLVSQGIIAIYLSHVHGQTQDRPLFVIDKKNSLNIK